MRPDTFTELIRRKLESIRPNVTDQDWTRMQSSLKQAGLSGPSGAPVAPAGSAPSWLLTVAGIGTASLLAVAVWQRTEINTLREKLTLQTTTSATVIAAPPLSEAEQTIAPTTQPASADQQPDRTRPDTVYVTRYVPIGPAERTLYKQAHTPLESALQMDGMNSTPEVSNNRSIAASRTPQNTTANTLNEPVERSDSPLPDNMVSGNDLPGNALLPSQPRLAAAKAVGKLKTRNSRLTTNLPNPQQEGSSGVARPTTATERNGELPRQTETVAVGDDASVNPAGLSGNHIHTLAIVRSLLARPINWNARLTRRFSQPNVLPTAVSQPESPASQSIVKLATTFRIGVGSDLRANYRNTGIVVETVLGGHWVLGAGLVRSGSLLGSFVTDDDYEFRTRRNFRREFAPGFDQKREIYGIEVRSVRYQIPVSIGYRIPVGRSLSILPAVGAYLDLSNDAQVTFSYRTPPPRPGYETSTFEGRGSVSLLNAYTAGAALEWQQTHWIIQGGMLYARPLYSNLNGTAAPALGGRLRLLYQF